MASSISDDVDLSISIPEHTITSFEPEPGSDSRKPKPSTQLDRWSRARAIKTGRKLERSLSLTSNSEHNSPRNGNGLSPLTPPAGVSENESDDVEVTGLKSIYMISDGTGWTAEHAVNAALGQFYHCLADRACAVNTHLFPAVDNVEKIIRIVKQAAKEGAILLYTIAEPSLAEYARKACKMWGVPFTDILSPITEAIGSHLGVSPSGIPRGAPGRNVPLTEDYFKRIEAIEFTIKQDDGALPRNLDMADIILTGVSRTGKTPLSIYLSQKGYKVANVPIVMGLEPPAMLFKVDQDKVFGLTINPVALRTIRRVRAKTLGLAQDKKNNYSDMGYVREDLVYASQIFARNPGWPIIDVTTKAIEETAAVILKIYLDRQQKCSVPRISKRY